MKIRSFVIAYALVLAILLFADRRPGSTQQDRYSHVVDLTDGQDSNATTATSAVSSTRIIAPAALIPGTWAAGQIPAERLIAPLVVMDLTAGSDPDREQNTQISLDDIAAWEARHGMIPQGAVLAIRRTPVATAAHFPIAPDAAEFLLDARNTIGFALETPLDLTSDRTFDRNLGRQLALHGSYVVEGAARFTALPATGSLIIVAPSKDKKPGEVPVRILAMVH
jgi:kynurenine formamidase